MTVFFGPGSHLSSALISAMLKATPNSHVFNFRTVSSPTKASAVAVVNVNQYSLFKNAQRPQNSDKSSGEHLKTKPGGSSLYNLVARGTKEAMKQ